MKTFQKFTEWVKLREEMAQPPQATPATKVAADLTSKALQKVTSGAATDPGDLLKDKKVKNKVIDTATKMGQQQGVAMNPADIITQIDPSTKPDM